jgi:hypothetical protein
MIQVQVFSFDNVLTILSLLMPSAVSTVNGDQLVEDLRRELAEAREQQAVAAEILATISSSATDANQVFAKIAASAARLCAAYDATIYRVGGDNLRTVAHDGRQIDRDEIERLHPPDQGASEHDEIQHVGCEVQRIEMQEAVGHQTPPLADGESQWGESASLKQDSAVHEARHGARDAPPEDENVGKHQQVERNVVASEPNAGPV